MTSSLQDLRSSSRGFLTPSRRGARVRYMTNPDVEGGPTCSCRKIIPWALPSRAPRMCVPSQIIARAQKTATHSGFCCSPGLANQPMFARALTQTVVDSPGSSGSVIKDRSRLLPQAHPPQGRFLCLVRWGVAWKVGPYCWSRRGPVVEQDSFTAPRLWRKA